MSKESNTKRNGATLTILGSGSGMPQSKRTCSGYLIEHDGRLTLLDCGSGVSRSFQAQGFSLTELDRVVISHTHPDHVTDLPLLIQHCHLSKKTTPLDVFVPSEFVDPFNQIIRAMYVIPERFLFAVNIRGYEAGVLLKRPVKIEAFANCHLAHYETDIARLGLANKMQSFSLRVRVDATTVFYSGDIRSFEDVVTVIGDSDFVILETSHVDLVKVGEFIRSHSSIQFILTHFTSGESAEALTGLARSFPNVRLAEDGMKVELGW